MALLALMPGWLQAAILGGVIGFAAFGAGHWHGASTARMEARLEAHEEALERVQSMEKNNADFLALPERERCVVFMRDSGLPESECDSR